MAENGFCADGEQEKLIADGATEITGPMPVNTDGGLIANGEPIGASGLRQVHELVHQLRGNAGDRQVARQPEGRLRAALRRAGYRGRHDSVPLTHQVNSGITSVANFSTWSRPPAASHTPGSRRRPRPTWPRASSRCRGRRATATRRA